MNLAERKYNFIQKLSIIDENLLEKLENFLKQNGKNQDWFTELSSEEKEEIEIGLRQANSNEFIDNDIVMRKFAKRH